MNWAFESFGKEKFDKYQSLDDERYLTGLAHVVSLLFPCSFRVLQYVSFSKFCH